MKSIITQTFRHWNIHNATRMGAALSYYTMLSIIPLLVLLISIASTFFNADMVDGTVMSQLSAVLGKSAAEYMQTLLQGISATEQTTWAALSSAVITMFGAIAIFSELDKDFDELWEGTREITTKKTWIGSVVTFIRAKIVALSFIPILAVLLALFIILTLVFTSLETQFTIIPLVATIIRIAQIIIPMVLGTLLFAIMYRILPDRTLPWNVVFLGAVVTMLLFMIGNVLIVTYINLFLHTSVFGAAASLVGLLVWVYYSAQVFFVGASFTYVYAKENGFIVPDEKVLS